MKIEVKTFYILIILHFNYKICCFIQNWLYLDSITQINFTQIKYGWIFYFKENTYLYIHIYLQIYENTNNF